MSGQNQMCAWWSMIGFVLTGCTAGNMVSDFQEPRYILIDQLDEQVEIRRYMEIAEFGDELAESTRVLRADLPATRFSGLVAARRVSGNDLESEAEQVRAQLERSSQWRGSGDLVEQPEATVFSFLGVQRNVLIVPIERRADLFRSNGTE